MINIGVIGCGHWGPNHIRNFNTNKRSSVVAFAEINEKTRRRIAEMYPDIEPLADFRKMLKNTNIDAVIVATPTANHYEIVRESLLQGKDVLCEKPLTISPDESQKLIDLADTKNLILMVGHTFIYNNGIQALKKYIDNGEIGMPLYIHLRRTNLGPIRQDVNVVYDLASHDIYIANYLLSDIPEQVYATGAVYLQPGLEDVAFITMRYPNGVLAHVHVSWLDPKKERRITVIGDKKMIVWDDLTSETIKIYNKAVEVHNQYYNTFGQFQLILKEGDAIIPKIKLNEPLANQSEHFLDCIINRTQPLSSGSDGLITVKILHDIQKSLEQNST